MPDWKQELRKLLTEAVYESGDGGSWDITISDERMKELEEMGLWDMNAAGWND